MIDLEVRRAALNPHNSYIVEAPAGSGKTEVLVRRMLSLLLQVEHPRNILAITFTRKAAAEMKERLLLALQHETLDPEKAQLLQELRLRFQAKNWTLADLEQLPVMTIDALCARILNQEGRVLDSDAEIIPDYSVLGDALMLALLEHLETPDEYAAPLATILLYFGNHIEKVKHLLLGILSQRAEWLSVFVARKNVSLRAELQANVKNLYETLWANWRNLAPKEWTRQLELWLGIDDYQGLKKIPQLLLTQKGELRKRFDKNNGLPPEFKEAYLELLENLNGSERWLNLLSEMQALPPLEIIVSEVADALVQILPVVAAHWQILLREHHYRDFQEEALQAVISLGNNDPVSTALLRFERELKHILVDEFQDTSRLQFRLLELITQTWQPQDGRTLFLVGDPMQSIYRFRDARVELFLAAKEKGLGNIKLIPLTLTANFRSDPAVLKFINEKLAQVFPKYSDSLTGAVPFTESTALRTYADAVGVKVLSFEAPELEVEALCQEIKAILARDPQAKIGILGRSRTHLKPLMQSLIQHQIQVAAENWGRLLDSQLILDLVSLTCALTHLGDRLAWMALLRSPMVGFNLDELLLIAQHSVERTIWEVLCDIAAGEASWIPAYAGMTSIKKSLPLECHPRVGGDPLGFAEKLKPFIAIMAPLIFAPEILLLTKVQKAFFALTEAFQFSDLEKNIIEQYWQFLAQYPWISSRRQFLEDLARLKLNYVIEGARVNLLTIHQAKGLEFDYVFLPNLNAGVRRDDPPLLRWQEFHYQGQFKLLLGLHKSAEGMDDPIYQYLKWLDKEEARYEDVRLLYVALTRAKKGLYLSYSIDAEESRVHAGSLLKLLNF